MRLSNAFEETEYTYGSYLEEYDQDENSEVRDKAIMQKIASIAIKRLTKKQLSVYTRFYIDGKSVADIAHEDETHISTVYKHLHKAEKEIFELKNFCLIYNGQEDLLDRFKQAVKEMTPDLHRILCDYYIKKLSINEIMKKYRKSYKSIRTKISAVNFRLSREGITSSDIKFIRKVFDPGVTNWIQQL